MPESAIHVLLDRADQAMQAAAVFLLAPDAGNLDRSRMLLHDAVAALIGLQSHAISKEWLGRLQRLRGRSRSLEQLLNAANAFYAGAFQAVGLNGVYTAGGRMTVANRAGLMSVEF